MPDPGPDDELMTVAQVAELLKINQETVRNFIRAGTLAATRVGRNVRVRHADVEAMTGGVELLTVAEVAEALKLNQQTIRNWIDQGRLPAVRIGQRRVRIRRTDLDAIGPKLPVEGSGDSVELLTVAEVADALRLNQQTIRNWIDDSRLPAIRIGQRRLRIRRTDLDAVIEHAGPDPVPAPKRQTAEDFWGGVPVLPGWAQ